MKKDKLIQALKEFQKASENLTNEWETANLEGDALTSKYPFSLSFDDLTIDIKLWVEVSIKELS